MSERPKVVVASRNSHKLRELGRMLPQVELLSLEKAAPGTGDLKEEGENFADNAISKAKQALALTGMPVLADDSGLEVDALGGAPGVHSARFSGVHGDTAANNALLLKKLKDVPDKNRGARFRCVIAYAEPGDKNPFIRTFEGTCEGRIARQAQGQGGFGYDPLFLLPDRGLTVAQLKPEAKDAISHRGQATAKLAAFFEEYFGNGTFPAGRGRNRRMMRWPLLCGALGEAKV